jgi:hypothetical protein
MVGPGDRRSFDQDMPPGLRKPGVFNRGRFGAALGLTVFLGAGLTADFVFVPAVFTALVLAADLTALGFLGITVNSSSLPQ